jgi:hypothetical protein
MKNVSRLAGQSMNNNNRLHYKKDERATAPSCNGSRWEPNGYATGKGRMSVAATRTVNHLIWAS